MQHTHIRTHIHTLLYLPLKSVYLKISLYISLTHYLSLSRYLTNYNPVQ